MEIPTNLKHKPVIVVEDYDKVDGRNALNMDAKGLSLGLAQWNDRGKSISQARYGDILEKNGHDSRKNYQSHVF